MPISLKPVPITLERRVVMFNVGDKVKYVGTSRHPEYQNLSVGVVKFVGKGSAFPVAVVFEGYDYGPDEDYLTHFHPCDCNELEKV